MVWESLEKNISLGNKSSIINKRATTLSNIGFVYSEQSDYHKALDYYFKALKMKEEIGDKKGKTTTLVNIGNVYNRQSDHAKALDYYFRALKMSEEIGDKNGIANNLCGIGLVYSEQSDYPRALDYYFRALKMQEEIGDKYGIAINLGNIGNVYYRQSDYPRALDYYFRVLKMQEEIGDKKGIARNLGNIGLVYSNQSDYPQALDHYFRALKMKEEIGDKYEMANTLGNIGVLYTRTKKYKDAEEYLQKALTLCDSIKALYYTMHFEKFYSNLDSARGNHRGSLMHYKKYIVARDSIFNEENNKKQARVEIKYEMEKAQLIKAQQEKEAARIEKETRDRRDHLQYSLIVLGLVVIITPLSFISRLKVKPRIAEGMIFMVFLIFFEFVLVLLDPYLDLITGGAPGLKLLVNALIAAFIFPFHAVCERWVKGRILRGGGVQTQVL
ncbi:MAG: hypothetical protein A3H98_02790 [Bacteroidetes bacterium RIFCSPLOWO2_02_FULL_36_8]|nr:MAG: hypothetical protein A3H98_02790 [Bacteroidetes bacterium RIFCSPLOWO2_02_FULL_36_8]